MFCHQTLLRHRPLCSEQLAEQSESVPSVDNLEFVMESLALGHTVLDQKTVRRCFMGAAALSCCECVLQLQALPRPAVARGHRSQGPAAPYGACLEHASVPPLPTHPTPRHPYRPTATC